MKYEWTRLCHKAVFIFPGNTVHWYCVFLLFCLLFSRECSFLFIKLIEQRNDFFSYFDGLVQDCNNFIANTLELLQSCTKLSISIWLFLPFCSCKSHTDIKHYTVGGPNKLLLVFKQVNAFDLLILYNVCCQSIPWLLVNWRRKDPEHKLTEYWSYLLEYSGFNMSKLV